MGAALSAIALLSALSAASRPPDPPARGVSPQCTEREKDPVAGEAAPVEDFVVYETATVVDRPLDTATGTVSLLDASQLELLAPLSAGDVLGLVPGALVLGDGSLAGLTTALLRGGDPNFTLVLVDGVPLNDATDQLGGTTNLSVLSLTGVDRMEIVRGPLSSFYGSTGLAGAVNLVTSGGEDRPGAEVGFETEGENLLRASFSRWGADSPVPFFAALTATRERGRIAEDHFEELALSGALELAHESTMDLELHGRLASWEADDYPEGSGGPALGTGLLRRSRHQDLSLGLRGSVAHGSRSEHVFDTTLTHRRLDRESPAIPPEIPPGSEDTSYARLRGGWTKVFATGTRDQWSAGLVADWERGANRSLLFLPSAFGGETAGDYRSRRAWGGALVEWLRRGPATVLEVSSRLDVVEGEGVQWSPRVGVGLHPGAGPIRLRASAGRAYKLPSFFALSAPPALGGNPRLRPETSVGGDLGAEWASRRLSAGATVYWSEYRELIDFDFETFRLVNRSRVRAQGLEMTLHWRPRSDLDLHAALTGQQVKDRDGSELRHRPDWFGSVRLRWRPAGSWRLQLDATARSQMLDAQVPVPDRTVVSGRAVTGLSALWDGTARWQAILRVENALGEGYESFIGFPGPDRSLRAGLLYRVGRVGSGEAAAP